MFYLPCNSYGMLLCSRYSYSKLYYYYYYRCILTFYSLAFPYLLWAKRLVMDIKLPSLIKRSNLIQDVNYYNKLEDPTDEENDMLDLAFGLTET